jgi:hypothetical protein
MATTDGTHICHFMLEQNARGYFTGNFVCTYCGRKVAQSQWFDTLTVTSSGRDSSHGLSRTPPGLSR